MATIGNFSYGFNQDPKVDPWNTGASTTPNPYTGALGSMVGSQATGNAGAAQSGMTPTAIPKPVGAGVAQSPSLAAFSALSGMQNLQQTTGSPQQQAMAQDQLARQLAKVLQDAGHQVKWQGDQLVVDGRPYTVNQPSQQPGMGQPGMGQPFAPTTAPMMGPPPQAPPGVRPMATGGVVYNPTLALLGERGPEAVVPLNNNIAVPRNPPTTPTTATQSLLTSQPPVTMTPNNPYTGAREPPPGYSQPGSHGAPLWEAGGANPPPWANPTQPPPAASLPPPLPTNVPAPTPTPTKEPTKTPTKTPTKPTSQPTSGGTKAPSHVESEFVQPGPITAYGPGGGGGWMPNAPTYRPGEIPFDDIPRLTFEQLLALAEKGNTLEPQIEASVKKLLENPSGMSELAVGQMKAKSKDELSEMAAGESADMRDLAYQYGISQSPWYASEQGAMRRGRDKAAVESYRDIDIQAANKRKEDERLAIALSSDWASQKATRRQNAVFGAMDAALGESAARGDRLALREQTKQMAAQLGISAEALRVDWMKAVMNDLSQRYGIDVGAQIDWAKIKLMDEQGQENLMFQYAQLAQQDEQFGASYGLNVGQLQLQNAQLQWLMSQGTKK